MCSLRMDPRTSVNGTELQMCSHINYVHTDAEGGNQSPVFYSEDVPDTQFAGIPSLMDSGSPPKSWADDASSRALSLPRQYETQRVKAKGLFSDKKGCVIVFLLVMVLFIIGLIVGIQLTKECDKSLVKTVTWQTDYQGELSRQMQAEVNADEMRSEMKQFSRAVHQAGTTENGQLAEMIFNVWNHANFDEVFLDNYTVQLSVADETKPNTVEVFKSETSAFKANSSSKSTNGYFPYNAYSPRGSVKGQYVFVNYGKSSDFDELQQRKISLENRIVVARIGSGYRAGIADRAASAGAIGLIIYADPTDFAFNKSQIYPNGWLLPGDAPIFGNMRVSGGGGDPLTPGLPAVVGIHRWRNNTKFKFSPIPVQSVGYDDARKLLNFLKDNPVPSKWNKTLAKYIGPTADITVRIETQNRLVEKKISNVVAVLRGRQEPDRVVVVGNHFDAWLFGASDPLSGTVIVQQAAAIFSREMKRAYEPRRTLVFVAWDAEEMGTIGSTEFTERLSHRLGAQTVAYVNLDCPVKGSYSFFTRSSPLLRDVILQAANSVVINTTEGLQTVLQDWKTKLPGEKGKPELPLLGGGSDQASFLFRLAVPSIYPQYMYNGWMSNMPAYHTKYDTFDYMDRILDPGFSNHVTVARVVIDLLLRLVDSALLPLSIAEYPAVIMEYAKKLEKDKDKYEILAKKEIDLDILFTAINEYKEATDAFVKKANQLNDSSTALSLRQANDAMMQVSRAFLWSEGVPNRPYYKNVLLSPSLDNSYDGSVLSGFRDGLYLGKTTGDWHHAYRQFSILLNAIRCTTMLLNGKFH